SSSGSEAPVARRDRGFLFAVAATQRHMHAAKASIDSATSDAKVGQRYSANVGTGFAIRIRANCSSSLMMTGSKGLGGSVMLDRRELMTRAGLAALATGLGSAKAFALDTVTLPFDNG